MQISTLYKTLGLGVVALAVGASLLNANKGETEFRQQALLSLASQSVALNELTGLKVTSAGDSQKVNAEKVLQKWQLSNLHGHPAEVSKLAEFMTALNKAKVLELKTNKVEKFHRLGLRDISNSDSQAVQLQLTDGDKQVELLVGLEAKSGLGQYVRFADQQQTYLIDSVLPIPSEASDWLQAEVLDLSFKQVRSVEVKDLEKLVVAAKRELVELAESNSEDQMPLAETAKYKLADNFQLDQVEGELQYPSILDGLVRNLVGLTAKDVLKTPKDSFELTHQLSLQYAEDEQVTALEAQTIKSQGLSLYKESLEQEDANYWAHIEDSTWWYQISEFDYKQLVKGKDDYLQNEAQ